MEKRLLGNTGLAVTPLGFGAGQIGVLHTPRPESCRLLNVVLDSGVNLIDTAACYGDSEEKIGEFISHRRNEYVLVTKCGSHVDDDDPPAETRLALFRIAQESMNNAAKHGPPSTLRIALDLSDDEVCLTIEDDGPGLHATPDLPALAADGHFGLLGMQERAEAVSGTLLVENRPDRGLRVRASVPRLDAAKGPHDER